MKIALFKYIPWSILVLCSIFTAIPAAAGPVGFASLNGGTTGGEGGTTITVDNGADLYQALKDKQDSSTPLIIQISGTITPSNTSQEKIDVKDVSDVTLIGAGSGAEFDGIGIKLTRAHNIIIQNLIIHDVDTGDKDGIGIEGASTNIWIDHNEIYASLDVDKDYYDGLLDSKKESEYITISYNYLHDSWKTSLHGSSDSDSGERNITFHHNHFENINSRGPLFRFGQGHLFNNYYNNIIDTGINSRMGAKLRIENNHFENAKNPVVSFYSDEIGYWDLRDNLLSNVTWEESDDGVIAGEDMTSTTTYDPPYSYVLDDVDCVRSVVLATAGAGKDLAVSDGSCSVEPGDQTTSDNTDDSTATQSEENTDTEDSSSETDTDSGDSEDSSDSDSSDTTGELGTNLSIGAGADGSSKASGTSYGNVTDGNLSTYWQPTSTSGERISVKWSASTTFNTVIIREISDVVSAWSLVNHDTDEILSSGDSIGEEQIVYLDDVSMTKVDLIIDSADASPQIAELEVYNASVDSSIESTDEDTGLETDTDSDASTGTDESASYIIGDQCNWNGTLMPLCDDQQAGCGWRTKTDCIEEEDCLAQGD